MSGNFITLKVASVRDEIGGSAKTISFEVPEQHRDALQWGAGQHLTLRFTIEGKEVRRSYSISSAPQSGQPLRITVKRVREGLVSNYIGDHAKAGLEIDVMPPFGTFTLAPNESARRTYYFFGAGSGITPLYSMLNAVLCAEPNSTVHLLYGNAKKETILLEEELDTLSTKYPKRITIRHVLTNQSAWSGFSPWRKGKIDRAAIEAFFTEQRPYAQDTQYFVCGPGTMNADIRSALTSLDVPTSRIHMESYGGDIAVEEVVGSVEATAIVTLGGEKHTLPIAAEQTILEAALGAGLSPPFSCESGVCGACRAQVQTGDVKMRACMALDEAEVKRGAVLTCQALAISKELTLSYD